MNGVRAEDDVTGMVERGVGPLNGDDTSCVSRVEGCGNRTLGTMDEVRATDEDVVDVVERGIGPLNGTETGWVSKTEWGCGSRTLDTDGA